MSRTWCILAARSSISAILSFPTPCPTLPPTSPRSPWTRSSARWKWLDSDLNQFPIFLFRRQLLDEFLHLLRLAFVRHERGIISLDNDRIAQADNRNGCAVFDA